MTDENKAAAIGPATKFLADQIGPLTINQRTHYAACERYQVLHFAVGCCVVILSTAIGAFSFAEKANFDPWFEIGLSAGSLVAGILAAIGTFANFSGWSARHQRAAVEYGQLLREAKSRIGGTYTEEQNSAYLERFKSNWHAISSVAPVTFRKARAAFGDK